MGKKKQPGTEKFVGTRLIAALTHLTLQPAILLTGRICDDILTWDILKKKHCPEIPCGYCVWLLLSPWRTEVPILSTYKRTECVAREIAGTLSGVSVPQRRSTPREYGAVRLSPGHALFLAVETRPVLHLCGLNRPVSCGGNAP